MDTACVFKCGHIVSISLVCVYDYVIVCHSVISGLSTSLLGKLEFVASQLLFLK